MEVQYQRARRTDLSDVARIFLAAFPESVEHYAGGQVNPEVIEDAFDICLDSEPEAFIVAETDGKLAGYIFAPAHFSRLIRAGLSPGNLPRMLGKWITGRYGIGTRPFITAVRNWLKLLWEAEEGDIKTDARILSIAVDPAYQAHGIGSGLVDRALEYLQHQDQDVVRLEVRPDNPAAKRLYEKRGFETRGRMKDTQGDWLIMLKNLSGGTAA